MKLLKSKFTPSFLILGVVMLMTGAWQLPIANAAGLTVISDTMSREMIGVGSTHRIVFTSTSAIAVSTAGITLSIPYSTGTTFTGGTFVVGDIVGLCHGATGVEHGFSASCSSNDETISAGAAGANQWGFTTSGSNPVLIVLAAPTTFTNTITAGQKVTIYLSATHMINPASLATPTISITTTSDTGAFTVPIVDNDQVTVTATVNQTIVFDLESYATATTTTETAQPYSVALGTLVSTLVSGSNESSINSIWVDLGTNASGGAVVTVLSANAALKSTAVPTDTIPSVTATMANGTANYGLCVKSVSATTGTMVGVTPFNGATCTTTPTGNTVGAVTILAQPILKSGSTPGPVDVGRAEIMLDAENSAVTPAHTDYGDTLTFIATATF